MHGKNRSALQLLPVVGRNQKPIRTLYVSLIGTISGSVRPTTTGSSRGISSQFASDKNLWNITTYVAFIFVNTIVSRAVYELRRRQHARTNALCLDVQVRPFYGEYVLPVEW